MDSFNIDDQKIYEFISNGNTDLIFQLNSQIGKKYSKLMKPQNIDELAMLLALIRPNMLDSGMDEEFLAVRNKKSSPNYPDERLGKILDKTHGCALYQEQIIEMGREVAGFDLAQADVLRYAVGKKKKDIMKDIKKKFLRGGLLNKYKIRPLLRIWKKYIEAAARYSFPKSHATCYAYLSAQTAFYNHYKPLEFICSNLLHSVGNFAKMRTIINVAYGQGVEILGPRLKDSQDNFSINNNSILFGFRNIKGVGVKSLKVIKKIKNVANIDDFLINIEINKTLDKTSVEALIFSGAVDYLESNRNFVFQKYNAIKKLSIKEKEWIKKEIKNNTISNCLKELSENGYKNKIIIKSRCDTVKNIYNEYIDDSNIKTDLKNIFIKERDLIGISLSGCETDFYSDECDFCYDIKKKVTNDRMFVYVIVDEIKIVVTAKKEEMAFIKGFDSSYMLDIVVFPKQFEKIKKKLKIGKVAQIFGRVDKVSGESVVVQKIKIIT